MTTLAEFLRGLDNIASVEQTTNPLDHDRSAIYRLENSQGEAAFVLVVTLSMRTTNLVQILTAFSHAPLLVLVDAPPPEAGATLYNWRDDHQVLVMLHALFFGKVYYWWGGQVTAVHFDPRPAENGFAAYRTAQPAPADRYPFTRLYTSQPHNCFHADLEGYEWHTMSFREGLWWEPASTSGTGYSGFTYQHQAPPRREWQSTERPPMSDAEFLDYLQRIGAEAQRVYEQTHYTPPPPIRSRNAPSAALATLGLTSGATPEQIKAAYRAKARLLHPDRNPAPEATRQMQELNLAYELLMRS